WQAVIEFPEPPAAAAYFRREVFAEHERPWLSLALRFSVNLFVQPQSLPGTGFPRELLRLLLAQRDHAGSQRFIRQYALERVGKSGIVVHRHQQSRFARAF